MSRKNGHVFPQDDAGAIKFSAGLSATVKYLAERSGVSQSQLAKEMGYSRVTLNQVLKSYDGRYPWRLPMMFAVCRVFGIEMAKLVELATIAAYCGREEE
jgi:DNA-binding XRE family transcriptional regulator